MEVAAAGDEVIQLANLLLRQLGRAYFFGGYFLNMSAMALLA